MVWKRNIPDGEVTIEMVTFAGRYAGDVTLPEAAVGLKRRILKAHRRLSSRYVLLWEDVTSVFPSLPERPEDDREGPPYPPGYVKDADGGRTQHGYAGRDESGVYWTFTSGTPVRPIFDRRLGAWLAEVTLPRTSTRRASDLARRARLPRRSPEDRDALVATRQSALDTDLAPEFFFEGDTYGAGTAKSPELGSFPCVLPSVGGRWEAARPGQEGPRGLMATEDRWI